MKVINYTGMFVATSLAVFSAQAENQSEDGTNRFSLSARVGFNISAKFKNRGVAAVMPRLTPDGSLYNYDDGYVLNDSSDSFGGLTWNWGYDNAAQINSANNTIAMNRSSAGTSVSSREKDDFSPGAELVYSRQLGHRENLRFGMEIGANILNLEVKGTQNFNRVTDSYSYIAGTTPPGSAYQGTFNGPGFVISTNITSSVTSTSLDRQKFDGNLWGLRLGPYLEFPLSERLNLNVIGGVAFGFMDAEVSWKQNGASGRGRDGEFLWGGYVGANLSWQFGEDWSLAGGVQCQSLQNYGHSFDGRKVEVSLRDTVFVTLGVSYAF